MRCPICNKIYTTLTHAHIKTHNMTVQEFKELHPKIQIGFDIQKTNTSHLAPKNYYRKRWLF